MANGIRVKCSKCGNVYDIETVGACPGCGALINIEQGSISLYRMGSPIGVAMGFSIYVDGQPFGHLANKELVKLSLPLGTHTLHCACGMLRKCIDVTVTLTPEAPHANVKAHIKPGFWTNTIVLEGAKPEEMPAQ